ncbi:MAG TPA: NAD(P)-dependent oxidoreductase [Nitrososphaera sp.]|nr:NAD(P)-dependent oxidoreductase [Nitrososphaera sp.]
MIIGIPREIKDHENRVSLTPSSISSLVISGSKVLIETHAGVKSGYSDNEYSASGASVIDSAAELYSKADLIVKVKEIQVSKGEDAYLKPHHIIFGFNHFESSRELTTAAIESRATFISFEKVIDQNGQMPILMPMSRIAGAMAGIWAGFFQNCTFKHDKLIRLKAGADQIKAKYIDEFERIMNSSIDTELRRILSLQDKMTVIFGGGSVGEMAAKICSTLGAKVTIVEKRDTRRKYLQRLNLPKCSIVAAADRDILQSAHIIIGSTYEKEKADRVIDDKMLKDISEVRKKIIIDVAVDQGGNFPFIDSSGKYSPSSTGSIWNPAQTDYFGNMFIRVPNIPSIVPRYASAMLSKAIVEYVGDIAKGFSRPEVVRAISIRDGKVLDEAIAKAHCLS